MNHIFRTIWNPRTGTCVATCEHASAQGRSAASPVYGAAPIATSLDGGPSNWDWRLLPLAVMLAWGGLAVAAPQGGVVSAGSASIAQLPGQTTITQNTPHVAINWQSFGIAAGQSVQFVQPGRSAVALNRVTGADPTAILGRMSANGQVFLVNPNGIMFGPGASVDVGGLVASTLNISDGDFMVGRYRFSGAGATELLNQGALQAANGGYVALLGAQVNNQGTVVAARGSVTMAAGQAMTLDILGNQLLNVRVDQGVANALLSNGGLLQADGGQVLMSTQAAGNLLANAVNNTGVVQAQTVENRQGAIVLLGSMDSGTMSLGGTLDVSAGPGQMAGRVLATGHQVGLFDAHILASGGAGGGQVLIGGGYQGRDPAVPHAQAVYVSAGAAIEANAREQGHGGQVVLWADGSTRALGQVSARGGALGGDGGLIETSGQRLDVGGLRVDTRAPLGQIGSWLLDPADITISGSATTDASATGGVFSPNSAVSAANINVGDLVTALGGSNVTLSTANTGLSGAGLGDIDVNAVLTWTAPTTLTLNAARDVNVNQAITGTDGSLALNAGRDVNVGAAITTTTGQLGFAAAQNVNINAATTITTGNLQAVAGRNVTVSAASSITTGNMVLRADNDGTGPGAAAGTVSITCGSNCLTVTTGQLSIRFNPADYASTSSEILAYANNLTGGGTLDAKAWVFGLADNKVYDGTTTATVSGLLPDVTDAPPSVSLGPVSGANFDTRDVGADKAITYASTFSSLNYDLFATAAAPVGTYQARADITPRPLTVNAVTDARIYNGTTSSVGVPTVTGLQTGDSLSGALTQAFASKDVLGVGASTLVASGSYSISDGNGGNNYSVSVLTAPGTISPAPLTITAQDASKVYGQTPVLSGFDASALVNGETVGSVTLASAGQVATASVAGSPYAIVPSNATGGTFTPSNYSISYVNGVLTVTPAPLTITAQDVNKVYGQTPVLSGFDASALVNGETVGSVTLASAGQVASASVSGSPYAIVPSSATGGTFTPGNYSISYVNGVLMVTPAPLAITAQDVSKVYGQTPALSGFDASALVNGETVGSVTLTSTGQAPTAGVAGSPYAIVPSNATGGTFTPSNYSISYVNGVLTVTPAPLTITAQDVNKVYGQAPALSGFDASALVNGETVGSVTLTSTGQAPTAGVAGSPYAIVPSNATGGTFTPSNYSISYVNGVLTVTPAPLTITAQDVSKVYGQTPVLSGFDASALVNGETVGSVTLASAGQAPTAGVAGSPYAIVASNATGGIFTPSNYSISYVNGVLTVTPATVVVPPEPPVVVVPPPEPPIVVVVPPEPPVVVPPEPPVVVPPEPPVVEPEQPVVQPPPVATSEEAPSATSEKQALSSVPRRDAQPVLLTVSPPGPVVQGPVTQAVAQAPLPMPLQTPAPAPLISAAPTPVPVAPAAAQEEVKPLLPVPMVSPRRPKQDRN